MVIFSDGIQTRYRSEDLSGLADLRAAMAIELLVRELARDHDDATAVVRGGWDKGVSQVMPVDIERLAATEGRC